MTVDAVQGLSMNREEQTKVAIVDYGLGNLFSVKHACEYAGMQGVITSNKQEIIDADAVILPGVGAFSSAMKSLKELDLVGPLRDIALSEKPLIGICLGMQLLMTESCEFGIHQGLNIISGSVVRFEQPKNSSTKLKVPHVGWNRVVRKKPKRFGEDSSDSTPVDWSDPLLIDLQDGVFMYFVHSFYVKPDESDVVLLTTKYGDVEFCSALKRRNVFACQFHPERSGPQGLQMYKNIASIIYEQKAIKEESRV